uniref:Octapeptide-repeat protein T2 n=1 Tax=Knipowitschia caucasica TaxID=637954 RepID=A0AAV2JC66_KNICA
MKGEEREGKRWKEERRGKEREGRRWKEGRAEEKGRERGDGKRGEERGAEEEGEEIGGGSKGERKGEEGVEEMERGENGAEERGGYGAFHGGLSTSSVFRRLRPWQGNKQAPGEHSLGGGDKGPSAETSVAPESNGCAWLRGEKTRMGGARQARGIGVKEMLTDTINVICLLPQEV